MSEKRRCEDCAHWNVAEIDKFGFSLCKKHEHLNKNSVLPDRLNERMTYLMDASGYNADMYTRGDFGCVLWKAKNDNADDSRSI